MYGILRIDMQIHLKRIIILSQFFHLSFHTSNTYFWHQTTYVKQCVQRPSPLSTWIGTWISTTGRVAKWKKRSAVQSLLTPPLRNSKMPPSYHCSLARSTYISVPSRRDFHYFRLNIVFIFQYRIDDSAFHLIGFSTPVRHPSSEQHQSSDGYSWFLPLGEFPR